MEKMGDWLGRQIRYGEPPTDPDAPFTVDQPQTRQQLFDVMMRLASEVATVEAAEDQGSWDEEHALRKFLYDMRETLKLPPAD